MSIAVAGVTSVIFTTRYATLIGKYGYYTACLAKQPSLYYLPGSLYTSMAGSTVTQASFLMSSTPLLINNAPVIWKENYLLYPSNIKADGSSGSWCLSLSHQSTSRLKLSPNARPVLCINLCLSLIVAPSTRWHRRRAIISFSIDVAHVTAVGRMRYGCRSRYR